MNDLAREKLCEIISRFGRMVCDDPKRVRALLTDFCPDLRREVYILSATLEQGFVRDLVNSSDALPWVTLAGRLVHRMSDELGLEPDIARWAVDSWALALGKVIAVLADDEILSPRHRGAR